METQKRDGQEPRWHHDCSVCNYVATVGLAGTTYDLYYHAFDIGQFGSWVARFSDVSHDTVSYLEEALLALGGNKGREDKLGRSSKLIIQLVRFAQERSKMQDPIGTLECHNTANTTRAVSLCTKKD